MDKIEKNFARLNTKERAQAQAMLARLARGDFFGLNLEKLKGYPDLFRIRKGNMRIVFRRTDEGKIFLIQVGRRREDTYRYL